MTPFIGQIMMFAGTFAPQGWALCDGQLLAISQYPALYSILGTTYGGDGKTTFALPDLRSRIPMHAGHGPGLSVRRAGESSGSEQVTLTTSQIPSHTHALQASAQDGDFNSPAGAVLGNYGSTAPPDGPYAGDAASVPMGVSAIGSTGGSQPHDNVQPFLCVTFVIALEGIFPSRS